MTPDAKSAVDLQTPILLARRAFYGLALQRKPRVGFKMCAALLLTLGALSACGAAPEASNDDEPIGSFDELGQSESAISNPTAASPSASRAVKVFSTGGYCTGSLVAPQWVLTARHCINGSTDPNDVTVTFNGVLRYVTTITLHPRQLDKVDVALLHLAAPYSATDAGGAFDTASISFFSGQTSTLLGDATTCYGYGGGTLGQGNFTISQDPAGPDQDLHKFYHLNQPNALGQGIIPGDSGGACWKGNQIVGIHKSTAHDVSGEVWGSWATTRRQCPIWSPAAYNTAFCSAACPCDVGEGDCDSNSECRSGLVCRANAGVEFGLPAGADVCATPTSASCPAFNAATPNASHCNQDSSSCRCTVGEGDCDVDFDCGSGLVCIQDTGPAVGLPAGYDICDYQPKLGCGRFDNTAPSTTFCSALCPCGVGQGDCDSNAECRGNLVCKGNQGALVGLPADYDICMKP